jgi:type II pantothenate kinase
LLTRTHPPTATLRLQVLAQLDAAGSPRQRLEAALRGVFAGNIFDLGAAATAAAYQDAGGVDFRAVLQKLLPRPWVIDDLDAILDRLEPQAQQQQQQQQQAPVYRKALFFVDNSGADVMLGMLPLARELLQRGTAVVLAANRVPSINDITAAELEPLLQVSQQLSADVQDAAVSCNT